MKNAVLGLSLLGACCALPLGTAQAQVIPVDQYPCSVLMADTNELLGMVFWTDGYLSAVTGNTVSDSDYLQEMIQTVGEYCRANPNAPFWNVIVENYNVNGEEE